MRTFDDWIECEWKDAESAGFLGTKELFMAIERHYDDEWFVVTVEAGASEMIPVRRKEDPRIAKLEQEKVMYYQHIIMAEGRIKDLECELAKLEYSSAIGL
jgi:hypothetical protein